MKRLELVVDFETTGITGRCMISVCIDAIGFKKSLCSFLGRFMRD